MKPTLTDLGPAGAGLTQLELEIRTLAGQALAQGQAAVVIGHCTAWRGWQAVPHFARTPEEAAQLVREQIGMVSQQTQRAGRTVSTVIIVAVAGLMILIGSVCVLLLLTPGS